MSAKCGHVDEFLLEDDLSYLSSVSRGRRTVCRKEVRNCFIPLIQFPRVESDWLIADPSLSLSPVAPVESALSLRKQNYTF